MALTHTPQAEFNSPCPDFKLKGTDGQLYALSNFKNAKALVVMFICNHCPYVKAVEDRLIQLGHDLKAHGVDTVAICSNDAQDYPEDSFENLAKRAKEKHYPFPYLWDQTQEVAKKFGAVCTPDFFVYDVQRSLKYRGRLDDSWKDASKVKQRDLFDAAVLMAKGQAPARDQVSSMGCSIKWSKNS